MLSREFKLIFRNGITIYLVIAPALLSLVFLFVFGSVQKSSVTYAVDRSVPQELVSKLGKVADIEYESNMESLRQRVSGADSIAGIYVEDGSVKLLVEGNETSGFAQSRKALVDAAFSGENVAYVTEMITGAKSLAYTISMTCILLLALFIGGATQGLGGVTERESGVIKAIRISPMTLSGYIISKILPALLFGIVSIAVCAIVMGEASVLLQYLLLALSSAFVSGIIAFLIIAFADNQIAAVGVLKIIMPAFLVVGISAAFVPHQLLAIYYPLPMYWQYAAIKAINAQEAYTFPLLMILITGFVWFAAVVIVFAKKTSMKVWR
jgi:hypothetical protein